VLGFASFSLGLVVAGAAPAWPILLLGRGLQGFGAGSLSAIAFVAVARGYPRRLRPRLLALLSSAWITPALVGPAVAGQVAEHASWRLVFIGILPPMAVAAWMLLPSLAQLGAPGELQPSRNQASLQRVTASLRLAAGAGLVLFAASLQNVFAVLLAASAGVLLAAPALRALLPTGTFTLRTGLPAAVAVRGLQAFGFFGSEALIPLALSTQRGVPPSLVGLSLTAGALAWVLGAWIQDRAESRSAGSLAQRTMRVLLGLLLIAVSIGGVAAVILSPGLPVELVILGWGIGGLGMGLSYPGSTLTALGQASAGEEGTAAASLQVAETVGIAMGTGATGALLALAGHTERAMSDGLAWGFVLSVAAILAALAPASRLAPTFPRDGSLLVGAHHVGDGPQKAASEGLVAVDGNDPEVSKQTP
jgi:MFS family permease